MYDPTLSERGALVCVARAPRKKSVDDFQAEPVIHNPHALPLFRDQPSRKRQREKVLKDPLKSHKPELPITGPGFGGRVGSTKGSLLTQYLLKVISLLALSYIIYNLFENKAKRTSICGCRKSGLFFVLYFIFLAIYSRPSVSGREKVEY